MSDSPEPTVTELFARDPMQLTEQDIHTIVENLRKSRQRFVQGNLTAGKPERKKSAAQKKAEAIEQATGGIDLSSLGL